MGSPGRQWTVLDLIIWTKDYLARAGVEEPRLSAELLLTGVLGCRRVQLYTQYARIVEPQALSAFRGLVRRAAEQEPVAYLLGHKEFYSLSLKVTPDVLIPRPETELLADAALGEARAGGGAVRMWDACTGSGCVAVAVAHYAPNVAVLATDISEPALAVARANVQAHGLDGRVRVERADLLELPPPGADLAPFDVITANPPYVSEAEMERLPAAVRHEPRIALCAGPTGLECIRQIVRAAPGHLRGGGLLAVEIALGAADGVYRLLDADGRYRDVRFVKDAAGIERTVLARRAT